jgi:nitrogen fixation-related uncharacterized protein
MANIGKKGLDLPKIPTKNGETDVPPGGETRLSPEQKYDLLLYAVFGFGLVCLLAMIALLASTWQFKSKSYDDYSKAIREYNDKRWSSLEERIHQLEIKLIPTPIPTK